MKEAFLDAVDRHQALIYKVCRLYEDSKEDREDLFQEIVFQLWKAYPTFRGEAKLSSWIYRIALNTAMASFRKRSVDIDFKEHVPDTMLTQEDPMSESLEDELFTALKKLDIAERAIVSLYLEGISYAEIAEIMGITENYVGVRLNRIKNKLKSLINA